LRPDTFL